MLALRLVKANHLNCASAFTAAESKMSHRPTSVQLIKSLWFPFLTKPTSPSVAQKQAAQDHAADQVRDSNIYPLPVREVEAVAALCGLAVATPTVSRKGRTASQSSATPRN
jgi:hypothetical protein